MNSYEYGEEGLDIILGILGGFLVFVILIGVIIGIFSIICKWKIFKKAGKEGWISLIPLYNTYTLFEIAWGNGWVCLSMLAGIIPIIGPIVTLVMLIITFVKLGKAFGKSGGFGVGLIFLSPIFMGILAFDSSKYIGQANTGNANNMNNMNAKQPIEQQMQNVQNNNGVARRFCTNCGTPLEVSQSFCPNCGTKKNI